MDFTEILLQTPRAVNLPLAEHYRIRSDLLPCATSITQIRAGGRHTMSPNFENSAKLYW